VTSYNEDNIGLISSKIGYNTSCRFKQQRLQEKSKYNLIEKNVGKTVDMLKLKC